MGVDIQRGNRPLDEVVKPYSMNRHLVRAVVASTVGSTIEWYDFLLYSTAAPLVFPTLFFPSRDPLSGVLIAFSTQFVGFAARPLGGVIFGYFGDRVGRKATLIATLLTMGVATTTIGLVPGYNEIGIWAGVLLTACRILQGIGVGGEWAGGIVLAMEWSGTQRRGFVTSWPQIGGPLGGAVLAPTALLIAVQASGPAFVTTGWRVPFLLSFALVALGLYVRLGVLETPIFSRLLEERRTEPHPVRQVLSRHRWDVTLTALTGLAVSGPAYVVTSFVIAYGTTVLKMSAALMLIAVILGSAVAGVLSPFSGHLSDRFGRRRIYRLGLTIMATTSIPQFMLLNTRVPILVILSVLIGGIAFNLLFGIIGVLIAETFTGRLRYTGASIGYNLTSIIGGGPAPLIATFLLATFRSWVPIALYISACAVISMMALTVLPDRSRRDHAIEYDETTYHAAHRLAPVGEPRAP